MVPCDFVMNRTNAWRYERFMAGLLGGKVTSRTL